MQTYEEELQERQDFEEFLKNLKQKEENKE